MKKTLTIGSVASMMTMAVLTANAQNLLLNGNFNTGDYTGWYTYAADGTMANTITTTPTFDGSPNAQMVSGDTTYRDALGQVVSIGGNQQYNISFDYYVNVVPTSFAISVTYDDAGNNYLGYEFPTGVLTSAGGWETYSGNFTTPANTASLKLEFELYSAATVNLDNVSLTPAPEPTTFALLGSAGLGLLVLRRRRV